MNDIEALKATMHAALAVTSNLRDWDKVRMDVLSELRKIERNLPSVSEQERRDRECAIDGATCQICKTLVDWRIDFGGVEQ